MTRDRAQPPRTLLITGGSGTLGQALARYCVWRGLEHRLLTRKDLDITHARQVQDVLEELRPWAVINAAGYVRVDDAEREPRECMQVNALGAANLAEACAERGIRFLTYSSDLVFDGLAEAPYLESSPTAPINVYGLSKAESERFTLATTPEALVVRTSAFFGPWDEYNFATQTLKAVSTGNLFQAIGDVCVSPTYVPDLVQTSLDLLIDGEKGIWHLANPGEVTWFDFAREVAEAAGADTGCIQPTSVDDLQLPACRPHYSVLGSERGRLLPALGDAVGRFADAMRH